MLASLNHKLLILSQMFIENSFLIKKKLKTNNKKKLKKKNFESPSKIKLLEAYGQDEISSMQCLANPN